MWQSSNIFTGSSLQKGYALQDVTSRNSKTFGPLTCWERFGSQQLFQTHKMFAPELKICAWNEYSTYIGLIENYVATSSIPFAPSRNSKTIYVYNIFNKLKLSLTMYIFDSKYTFIIFIPKGRPIFRILFTKNKWLIPVVILKLHTSYLCICNNRVRHNPISDSA